jgi:ATP-dependent RNA helicase DeaD
MPETGFVRFFINFGKTDGLYPNQLIELINKCVPGKVRIGKIDLRDSYSFFEVEEKEGQRVMNRMNSFEVEGRQISVEPAQGKKGEGGNVYRKNSREGDNTPRFYDRFDKQGKNKDKAWRKNKKK